jgi:hypothetical protein
VEADTALIGGKERNKHMWKRDPSNIGTRGKEIVHVLVERGGEARSHHIADVTGDTPAVGHRDPCLSQEHLRDRQRGKL